VAVCNVQSECNRQTRLCNIHSTSLKHPHTADVINSDLLPSSYISISPVSVLKREGEEETEARKDGW